MCVLRCRITVHMDRRVPRKCTTTTRGDKFDVNKIRRSNCYDLVDFNQFLIFNALFVGSIFNV